MALPTYVPACFPQVHFVRRLAWATNTGERSSFPCPSPFHLGLEWQGQMQPGRLQSLCLVSYVAFSLQKEEMIRGQTPRGYPTKELSVDSGDVSG